MALCQGAKRYPELTDLLPKRPDDAQTCEFCDGSGLANDLPEHLRESIVCFCGGLGWIASAAGPLNARVVSDSYRTEKVKSFRLFAVGILIVVAGVLVWANWPADSLDEHVEADRVVISKSDQSLALLRNGQVLRMYPVSLGANPVGHKQREGDERTPEGIYVVDYRKPDSSFHRALHISYPNAEDIDRAARSGVDPGGLIMIHGLPNRAPFLGRLHRLVNWTDGCIAVTNKEMDQIWAAVDDGTAVEIRP
ncbi:MAG: L,D-transpeptidase family protein [Acidobacteria bacterium]|nr:L,D-transpeptidase family protein [Acidobacteriota bacterium]